jgi:hypothetical protein
MSAVHCEDLELLVGDTPYPAGDLAGFSVAQAGDGALKISKGDLTDCESICGTEAYP